MVRANYDNHEKGIDATYDYLNRFFSNLLQGGNNVLRNRDMLVPTVTENKAQIKRNGPGNTAGSVESAVLAHLERYPDATQAEAADAVGRSRRTVQGAISSLKEKGLVEREGSKKTGKWVVK